MNWLFEKMDDQSIIKLLNIINLLNRRFFPLGLDDPLPQKKNNSSGGIFVSEENVMLVSSMGFTAKQSEHALRKTVHKILNQI